MARSDNRDYFGERSGANSLTWAEAKRGYDDGQLIIFVDRGMALSAAASGPKTSWFGGISGLLTPVVFIAGIGLGFFVAWWWFFIGAATALLCFRASRQSAVAAVRNAALSDERLFLLFREKKMIWLERRSG